MSNTQDYETFVRERITELRLIHKISEHRMSLDLDKSGSYIRGISSGVALPSLKELFNIIRYFGMDPVEFFAPVAKKDSIRSDIEERLNQLSEEDLVKVRQFLDWIHE